MDHQHYHALSPSYRILVPIVLVASLGACSRYSGIETGDWEAVTETAGNITTVHTISGSVWRGGAQLVEEASIGIAEGEDPYLLGDVSGIAAYEDRIFVLDWSVPVLRVYDHEGRHIKDIGRAGSGPGEFRMPWSLDVDFSNGRIYVRDDSQMRINVYSPDGETVGHIRLSFGLMTSDPMVITDKGLIYTPALVRGATGTKDAMVAYTLEGATGDTIIAPEITYEPPTIEYLDDEGEPTDTDVPFTPSWIWALTPDLATVTGISNEYRFEIRHGDGSVTVLERTVKPVHLHPDEKEWYRRRLIAGIRRTDPEWSWRGAPIPDTKPFFIDLVPDRDGRIWVLREGEGIYQEGCNEEAETYREFRDDPCWQNSYFFDVYEMSGRFLGSVQAPDGIRTYPKPYIDGDMMLILVRDNDGTPHVKRYRLMISE